MRLCYVFLFLLTGIILSCSNGPNARNHAKNWIGANVKIPQGHENVLPVLEEFLKTKNHKFNIHPNWQVESEQNINEGSGFIYNLEYDGQDSIYCTQLLDISRKKDSELKIKLAFINEFDEKRPAIKAIVDIKAIKIDSNYLFSSYFDENVKWFKQVNHANIDYRLSPFCVFDKKEAEQQQQDIEMLNDFFEVVSFPILYYSFRDTEDYFRAQGFSYHLWSDLFKTGGRAGINDRIFSANDSEIYTHEIAHLYIKKSFANCHRFIEEGLASYLGGSLGKSYAYHKENLSTYLSEHESADLFNLTDAYERVYQDELTSIPYFNGALLVEYVLGNYGKTKLFEIMEAGNSGEDLIYAMSLVGLHKTNYHNRLTEFLEKSSVQVLR